MSPNFPGLSSDNARTIILLELMPYLVDPLPKYALGESELKEFLFITLTSQNTLPFAASENAGIRTVVNIINNTKKPFRKWIAI